MPAINVTVNTTQNMPVVVKVSDIATIVTTQNIPVTLSAATNIPTIVGIQGVQGIQGLTVVSNTADKIAGEVLSGNRAVMVNTDGKVYYADKNTLSHATKILGITHGSATLGATVSVQTYGVMTEPSWTWDMSLPIFLSTGGLLIQTAPTTGFMLMLGFPLSSSSMLIDIDKPIIKI